jgi:antitoxin component YwqK of YwqJK toxin-antitoxin module
MKIFLFLLLLISLELNSQVEFYNKEIGSRFTRKLKDSSDYVIETKLNDSLSYIDFYSVNKGDTTLYLSTILLYKNSNYGVFQGLANYYNNGKTDKIIEYKQGKINGDLIYLDKNGKLKNKRYYINDTLDGYCINYFSNGVISEYKTCYFSPFLSYGKYLQFHSNGKVKMSGECIFIDLRDFKKYDKSDIRRLDWDILKFIVSAKIGVWKYFDENGKEIKIEDYKEPVVFVDN